MAGKVTQKSIMQSIRSNDNVSGGDGMLVSRMGQQIRIQSQQSGVIAAPGSSSFAVSFVEEFDNWITAHRYNWADGTEGEPLIYIAKPPHLRRDFYELFDDADPPNQLPVTYPNGNVFLYEYVSATMRKCIENSGLTNEYFEFQEITPTHYVGEVFYAMTAQTGLVNDDGQSIFFVELTTRMWARTTS